MNEKLEVCQGGPQNFCSEQVTIAKRQGTSENKNFEDKSTKTKTNFSVCDVYIYKGSRS